MLPPRFSFNEHCTETSKAASVSGMSSRAPVNRTACATPSSHGQRFELTLIGLSVWAPPLADQQQQRVGNLGEDQRHRAQQHLVPLQAEADEMWRREGTVAAGA